MGIHSWDLMLFSLAIPLAQSRNAFDAHLLPWKKKHPSESKKQGMLLRGKFNGRFMNVLHSDTPYSETYCMWKI